MEDGMKTKIKDEIRIFTYIAIRNPNQEFTMEILVELRKSFNEMALEVTDFLNYLDKEQQND